MFLYTYIYITFVYYLHSTLERSAIDFCRVTFSHIEFENYLLILKVCIFVLVKLPKWGERIMKFVFLIAIAIQFTLAEGRDEIGTSSLSIPVHVNLLLQSDSNHSSIVPVTDKYAYHH